MLVNYNLHGVHQIQSSFSIRQIIVYLLRSLIAKDTSNGKVTQFYHSFNIHCSLELFLRSLHEIILGFKSSTPSKQRLSTQKPPFKNSSQTCLRILVNYPQRPRNLPHNHVPSKPPHLWQHRKMFTLGAHHFLHHVLWVSSSFYILLFFYHKGLAIHFLHWGGWILQYCFITNMMCFIKVNKI